MDWNWFFSSFCQSAAALIGIIGAFIISRLLGLSEKISSTISHFENLIIDANKIIASVSIRRFYWYTKTNVRYDSDIKNAIRNGDFESLSETEIVKKIYDSDSSLYKDDDAVMEAFNELYKANRPKETKNSIVGGMFISHNPPLSIDLPPDGIWKNLRNEKDAIDQLEIEARTIIQHFEQNLQDLNSFDDTIKPLRVIIIMLMIAFPITVMCPLCFMPMGLNENPKITWDFSALFSIKFALIFVFLIVIEGVFYYFLTLTNQLKNKLSKAKEDNSQDLRDIKSYSPYFEE